MGLEVTYSNCQGVSHGPQHRLHLLRRPVPRAEALHQADQGDEDEYDRALLHILCWHDRCIELCCTRFMVLTRHSLGYLIVDAKLTECYGSLKRRASSPSQN